MLLGLLTFALAACGAPGGTAGDPVGERLEPGGVAGGADGTWLAAMPGALEEPVWIIIEPTDDPTTQVPLAGGAVARSPAYRVTASEAVGVSPSTPLLLMLPIPDGADRDHLALAVLEDELTYAPPDDDGDLRPEWVYVDAVVDRDVVVAPVLAIDADGWTAMLVEHPAFDSRQVSDGTDVQRLDTAFEGVCDPGFDDAPETCTATHRNLVAAMLEDAFDDLTALGFTDGPRLLRGAATIEVDWTGGIPTISEFTPGPYQIALRAASTIDSNASGMFSTATGSIWISIDTSGVTEARRRVVRHEYVHATQYGYDPVFASGEWLPSRWVIEGQAVVLESSFAALQRANRVARAVDDSLRRSRWDGNAFGDEPSSEYEAQDFWFYLAQRFGAGPEFLIPFMEQGMRATDVDTVLRRDYAAAFGASGATGGLPRAYWDWVRNQVFENAVDMTAPFQFGAPCTFNPGSATPVVIAYDRTAPPAATTETLGPLMTRVYRIDLPAWSGGGYGATMRVAPSNGSVRSVFFRNSDANCASVPAQNVRSVSVADAFERYYVLVANTSLGDDASYTLSFDPPSTLVIDEPSAGARIPEGSVPLRATIGGDGGGSVFWRVEGIDSDFLWTPTTASGEAGSVVLCDGSYRISASVTGATSGAQPSASVDVTVTDLGNVGPPPQCMPEVTIVDPSDGGTFTNSTPVTLRADARSRGVTTYPIRWRTGSATGTVIATGADVEYTFGAGDVDLFVTYGVAVDSVSFTVIDDAREPPQAVILAPANGASYPWFDDTAGSSGHTIAFAGVGTSAAEGSIGDSDLRWYTRRTDTGPSTWAFRGTGTTIDLFFGWASCTWQTYDVRLQVTDSIGLVGNVTHWVSIQPPIC